MSAETLKRIHAAARQRILYLPHAVRQMSRLDRMIRPRDVRTALLEGEVIEDYPDDARGHSALVFGVGDDGRTLHVVCSPKEEYLAIITAYIPDPDQWSSDFRVRRG